VIHWFIGWWTILQSFGVLLPHMQKSCVQCILQEQYIFVYDALLEALKAGKTVIGCSHFKSEFDKLCAVDPANGKSKLQQQFDVSCIDPSN